MKGTGMKSVSSPRLAAERLAAVMGWSVKGRVLRIGDLEWVQDSWWRVLGYVVDVMMRRQGLGMSAQEVWALCEFETRREMDKNGTWFFLVPDHGWPSLDVARMLHGHPEVVEGRSYVLVG